MTIFPNRPLQLVRLFSPYRSIGRSLCNLWNISNIRKGVSSDIQSLRSAPSFFFTNFEVLGYLLKLSFQGLMSLLKALIFLREIQSKSSPNFMIIRITHPNLLHGSDFLFFFLHELFMILRSVHRQCSEWNSLEYHHVVCEGKVKCTSERSVFSSTWPLPPARNTDKKWSHEVSSLLYSSKRGKP